MSNQDFVLNASERDVLGKGASRRLRRESGVVPGIVYGGRKKPQNISIEARELAKHLENEAFYSHIITLAVGDSTEQVILKDLQRHPAKENAMHIDLLRVSKTKKLQTKAPLHFINEEACKGVKVQGGKIQHTMTDVEISCLPADLPEYIEIDMIDVELGATLHISDIVFPKGVESVALSHGSDHDLPIASISKPKGTDEDEAEDEEAENTGE